jgi:ATP-dependent Clp protease ATP-binding subunit ClpA
MGSRLLHCRLSAEVEVVLDRCFVSAHGAGHHFITSEHMVLEMLKEAEFVRYLERSAVDVANLRAMLEKRVSVANSTKPATVTFDSRPTHEFRSVIGRAFEITEKANRRDVLLRDVFLALLDQESSFAASLLLQNDTSTKAFDRLRSRTT